MTLTKMVNGKRVRLSSSEESLKRDEWAQEAVKQSEIDSQNVEKKRLKADLHASVKSKLQSMGFTDEETEAMIND